MSNTKEMEELAQQIKKEARTLEALRSGLMRWTKPETEVFRIGRANYWVVRKDGKVTYGLEAIQREAVKLHNDRISATKKRIVGLHTKLAQLGKNGGAA